MYHTRATMTRSWIHKAGILRKKPLEKTFLDWVKSIQTKGYNGLLTIVTTPWPVQTWPATGYFLMRFGLIADLGNMYLITIIKALHAQHNGQNYNFSVKVLDIAPIGCLNTYKHEKTFIRHRPTYFKGNQQILGNPSKKVALGHHLHFVSCLWKEQKKVKRSSKG